MTSNKGKPSQQKADERTETRGNADTRSPRTVHRLDRSRSDEKGGKGASAVRHDSTRTAGRQRQRGA
jgi:hypothetical protein